MQYVTVSRHTVAFFSHALWKPVGGHFFTGILFGTYLRDLQETDHFGTMKYDKSEEICFG